MYRLYVRYTAKGCTDVIPFSTLREAEAAYWNLLGLPATIVTRLY